MKNVPGNGRFILESYFIGERERKVLDSLPGIIPGLTGLFSQHPFCPPLTGRLLHGAKSVTQRKRDKTRQQDIVTTRPKT